jgi:hypothetical protein
MSATAPTTDVLDDLERLANVAQELALIAERLRWERGVFTRATPIQSERVHQYAEALMRAVTSDRRSEVGDSAADDLRAIVQEARS